MRPFLRTAVAALLTAVVAIGCWELGPVRPAQADVGRPPASPDDAFVQRDGSRLVLDGQPFRFSGTNMYWLQLDDNVRDAAGRPTRPTRFRIDDGMASARAAGGNVVRAWANSVGCEGCLQPRLGTMDDSAFASLDYAVASAARHDQRLVLSLVDNWSFYHGSKRTYTSWRGLPESAFFTDPRVIADYEAFITAVLTHRNPVTGLEYRDDPTIMAWETGNELWCESCGAGQWFPQWTAQIADHIKSVAPRQLVVDGHGTSPECTAGCLDVPSLDIPSVDVVDDHHYPMTAARVRSGAAEAAAHGKGYLVGEYDWAGARGGDDLGVFLRAVESSDAVGALFWSVIPHSDRTGFVDHDDGFQYFFPGRDDDQISRTRQILAFSSSVSSDLADAAARSTVLTATPGRPRVQRAVRAAGDIELTWRGVGAAASYLVQRRVTTGDQNWTTVATGVQDQRVIDSGSTWVDRDAPSPAARPAYRVAAVALDGTLGPWSNLLVARPGA